MKCQAKTIKQDMGIARVMRVYGVQSLEAIEAEAAELLLGAYPWFRREDRLSSFYDAQAETLEYYLNRNVADHVYVNSRRGRREATPAEAFEDTINGTIWELTRRLKEAGFDADGIFDRAVGYTPRNPPLGETARIQREARIAWYAYNGRDAVRTWIGSSALALRDMTYPGGKPRFTIPSLQEKLLYPLADFIAKWLTEWFNGSDAVDRRLAAEHRTQLLRIERIYGFQVMALEERDQRGRGTVVTLDGAGEAPKKSPPPPSGELSRYEAVLREVMKSRI